MAIHTCGKTCLHQISHDADIVFADDCACLADLRSHRSEAIYFRWSLLSNLGILYNVIRQYAQCLGVTSFTRILTLKPSQTIDQRDLSCAAFKRAIHKTADACRPFISTADIKPSQLCQRAFMLHMPQRYIIRNLSSRREYT